QRAGAPGRCRGVGARNVVVAGEGAGGDEDPPGPDCLAELFVFGFGEQRDRFGGVMDGGDDVGEVVGCGGEGLGCAHGGVGAGAGGPGGVGVGDPPGPGGEGAGFGGGGSELAAGVGGDLPQGPCGLVPGAGGVPGCLGGGTQMPGGGGLVRAGGSPVGEG